MKEKKEKYSLIPYAIESFAVFTSSHSTTIESLYGVVLKFGGSGNGKTFTEYTTESEP